MTATTEGNVRYNCRAMSYKDIITIGPGKRGGRPCIRGLRVTVYAVRDSSEAEVLVLP